uniref:Uncharacterized protein n=1 Tax=Megaselia scalaris TaxID=36166 RepID=T1H400_MEGSC
MVSAVTVEHSLIITTGKWFCFWRFTV